MYVYITKSVNNTLIHIYVLTLIAHGQVPSVAQRPFHTDDWKQYLSFFVTLYTFHCTCLSWLNGHIPYWWEVLGAKVNSMLSHVRGGRYIKLYRNIFISLNCLGETFCTHPFSCRSVWNDSAHVSMISKVHSPRGSDTSTLLLSDSDISFLKLSWNVQIFTYFTCWLQRQIDRDRHVYYMVWCS